MKKRFLVFLTPLFILALVFCESSALAAPAPRLTNIQFIGITSDGNHNIMEKIDKGQITSKRPLKGSKLRVAVYVEGTEKTYSLRFYTKGGVDVTKQGEEFKPTQYLSGPNRIIYGKIVYMEFPLGLFSANIIVSAEDWAPPHQKKTAFLGFLKSSQ